MIFGRNNTALRGNRLANNPPSGLTRREFDPVGMAQSFQFTGSWQAHHVYFAALLGKPDRAGNRYTALAVGGEEHIIMPFKVGKIICCHQNILIWLSCPSVANEVSRARSEEHTSELQSPTNLVC